MFIASSSSSSMVLGTLGIALGCACTPHPYATSAASPRATHVSANAAHEAVGPRAAGTTTVRSRAEVDELGEPSTAPQPLGHGRVVGADGATKVRIDEDGQRYDANGRRLGRVDANGWAYDEAGAVSGRIETDGTVYGANGRRQGRIVDSGATYGGTVYGDTGALVGQVTASGQILDAAGRPVGRIESGCTGECRTQAIHSCLFD